MRGIIWKVICGIILILFSIGTGFSAFNQIETKRMIDDLPLTLWSKDGYLSAPPLTLRDDLQEVLRATPLIRTELQLRDKYGHGLNTLTFFGTGIVFGKYLLTTNHLVNPQEYIDVYFRGAFGFTTKEDFWKRYKVEAKKTYWGFTLSDVTPITPDAPTLPSTDFSGQLDGLELKEIWSDTGRNLALLEIIDHVRKISLWEEGKLVIKEFTYKINSTPFPYRIGDSDKLRLGNYIYIVGTPFHFDPTHRSTLTHLVEGIVINLKPEKIMVKRIVPEGESNVLLTSNIVFYGFGGGPMLAVTPDGRLELVGMTMIRGFGAGGLKINDILAIVKEKAGIDLAEVQNEEE